jgi:archaemetzincin
MLVDAKIRADALRRTLKTAAHETGHMFSLLHCVHFKCVMNGSNSLEESDQQPLWLCPQCLAKVCSATGADPQKHCEQLAVFARKHKMLSEQEFWEKSLTTLAGNKGAVGR